MANELIKNYSLDIDFLDYSKNRNVSNNIVYSDADINSTFINATLYLQGEIINLTDCVVTVGVKDLDDKSVVNTCEIISATEGKIKIPFTTSLLPKVGFSKFDISITKEDKKIVSPSFAFRVLESVTDDDYYESSPTYDILITLLSQVQGALDDINATAEIVEELNITISENEEKRKDNELQRIENENQRIVNENIRKSQEEIRQTRFTEKIQEINILKDKVNTDLAEKISEVDNVLSEKSNIFDEKVATVNSKMLEVDNKLIEVDITVSDKLTQLETDIANTINTKFDEGMQDISTKVDTKLNEATTNKFKEVDNTLLQKLNENTSKIDQKVLETDTVIQNVNDKITEVNQAKDSMRETVDSKISEFDVAKNDMQDSISNSLEDFEQRFSQLENENPTGEIVAARTSIDGTVKNNLSQRFLYDFDKKVDKIEGKGLSTNDFTDEEKDKLFNLENYIHPDTHNASDIILDNVDVDSCFESNNVNDALKEINNYIKGLENTVKELESQIGVHWHLINN